MYESHRPLAWAMAFGGILWEGKGHYLDDGRPDLNCYLACCKILPFSHAQKECGNRRFRLFTREVLMRD
jgi:hypothetical protein